MGEEERDYIDAESVREVPMDEGLTEEQRQAKRKLAEMEKAMIAERAQEGGKTGSKTTKVDPILIKGKGSDLANSLDVTASKMGGVVVNTRPSEDEIDREMAKLKAKLGK